jgi:hypothetical protein
VKRKQQFGGFSTCLFEKEKRDDKFYWIHVLETWLQTEEPVVISTVMESNAYSTDEDTVATGTTLPRDLSSSQNSSVRNATTTSSVTPVNPFESITIAASASLPVTTSTTSTKHITILLSNQSLSKEQTASQQTTLDVLSVLKIIDFVDIVDGANPNDFQRQNELFKISNLKGTYPQFFT